MARTLTIGDRSEIAVLNDLSKKGYKFLLPYGHDWRFDLAVYIDGRFIRIQVKTARPDKSSNGSRFVVSAKSYSRGMKKPKRYCSKDIDYIATYCRETDEVFYIPINEFHGQGDMSLRKSRETDPPNNSFDRYNTPHYIEDYLRPPS